MTHERDQFVQDVFVVLPLHPAAVQRGRAAVAEGIAMVVVDPVQVDSARLDRIAERMDHALLRVFPLVAARRRKHEERVTPVAEDRHTHLASETVRVPAVMGTSHVSWIASRESAAKLPTPKWILNPTPKCTFEGPWQLGVGS